MRRVLVLSFILMALTVLGCDQSEEAQSTQAAKETPTEKVADAAKTAAGEVKESAQAVAEKAAEVEKKAEPAVKQAAEEAKATTAAAVDQAKEMTSRAATAVEETASKAKETTVAAADSAVEKAKSAALATTTAAGDAVKAAQQAVSPETVMLEASYGNVSFPHALHEAAYACATCHGEGTPGAITLGKDKAHELCKGCHTQEGAGPTGCRDCHKK